MEFLPIYYSSILLSILPAMFILAGNRKHRTISNCLIGLIALFLFGLISFRVSGADLQTYKMEYLSGGVSILDVGYLFTIRVFNSINVPFPFFLLFCNLFIFYSLFAASRKFGVSFGFVFFVYILHLFIVRDLAHLRTSLAIAFIFLGFNGKPIKSLSFYLIAASIHISTLPLIGAILILRLVNNWVIAKFKLLIILLIPTGLLLQSIIWNLIDIAGIVSSRIRVYGKLSQQTNEYELNMTLIYFVIITVLFWLMLPKKESGSLIAKTLCLNIFGLYFYTVFGGVPEIGPRIFNVLMSFYPFQLAYILDLYYKSSDGAEIKTSCSFLKRRVIRSSFLIILMIPLVFRQDSYQLLEKVKFW